MLTLQCKKPFCDHIHCGVLNRVQAMGSFAREFVRAPSHVGSVCPSSRFLTDAMIKCLPDEDGLIIDLGAGSGILSEQLLRSGVEAANIIAVEISPGFQNGFNRRCPDVPLVIDDARNLAGILQKHVPDEPIRGIVSSLPLRVMPGELIKEIMLAINEVMNQRGGSLIQYTYVWWSRYQLARYGFTPLSSQVVIRNLPPARVESYVV